ncbi:proton-associated sugar transporter A [Neocloeon triangulifer]|uniref:proton-associated sugar transporter A n=1 Tax=Neocloeon triangulifer TaxID=2078957 RepID=UPI00286F8A5F|nr:proton-associated sugar transporter A [Neocloeon triangulifer]
MTEKLHEYQGFVGRLHAIRDNFSQGFAPYKERYNERGGGLAGLRGMFSEQPDTTHDFSHIYRQKTRGELVRISAAVMGIEFAYSAETAFVSPTLLKIGVAHRHMTLVWGLSPLIGFFLTPVLGSLSDRCSLPLGRRRPFIMALSLGVFLGLLLVPNGEALGYWFGDTHGIVYNASVPMENSKPITRESITGSHPWGVLFTVLGTVMLDFDADACQSPARAYLLDVTQPEDHARGLSTFTIMAGLGGCMGYAMGGINWDATAIGVMLGGHVRAVFTLITFIFIGCVAATITSFREIPLYLLTEQETNFTETKKEPQQRAPLMHQASVMSYGATGVQTTQFQGNDEYGEEISQDQYPNHPDGVPPNPDENGGFQDIEPPIATQASLRHYLLSIVHMPGSLRILCATNLFCWSAHVCYSLYFTDFVGEAVFGGDPQAAEGSAERDLYEDGVRFGCWGMAMYSLSCACYSLLIDKLVQRFRAKRVYVGGQLVYCTGMSLLALTRHKIGVIVFSWTAGVMYSTLFTMPYLLVAHYHAQNTFSEEDQLMKEETVPMAAAHPPPPTAPKQLRGLGTDVALVSSMVFLAQLLLSACMGAIVSWAGTTTAVVCVASVLSFCGAICATQVLYLDL